MRKINLSISTITEIVIVQILFFMKLHFLIKYAKLGLFSQSSGICFVVVLIILFLLYLSLTIIGSISVYKIFSSEKEKGDGYFISFIILGFFISIFEIIFVVSFGVPETLLQIYLLVLSYFNIFSTIGTNIAFLIYRSKRLRGNAKKSKKSKDIKKPDIKFEFETNLNKFAKMKNQDLISYDEYKVLKKNLIEKELNENNK